MKIKSFFLIAITTLIISSCSKDKVIKLPELNSSNIREILDVSPAYIFYNPQVKDSVELNRKNLISTTNWLVNVDKRLTLGQAIPKIQFIQHKKRDAQIHKNKNAKNYFTCHDLSINNLGFIEFTDIYYHFETEQKPTLANNVIVVNVNPENISVLQKTINSDVLETELKSILVKNNATQFEFHWNAALTFQDYISFKELILNSEILNQHISKTEVIFN